MKIPHNEIPVLVCQGVSRCGWKPHPFVRTDRMPNGTGRLMFKCLRCGHERLFGVVDLVRLGRAE